MQFIKGDSVQNRLKQYIEIFETGCSVSGPILGIGKPEDCPSCTRDFVEAIRREADGALPAATLVAIEPKVLKELVTFARESYKRYGCSRWELQAIEDAEDLLR
jgi:hypothetical protein